MPEPLIVRNILWRYCPPPAVLLDPMCGTQQFYELMAETLEGKGYTYLFGDIQKRHGQKWRGSMKQLPVRDGIADVAVYDPPFTNTDVLAMADEVYHRKGLRTYGAGSGAEVTNLGSVTKYTGTKNLAELHEYHIWANAEYDRVLKPGGWILCKLYDRHEEGILHMEHACVVGFFPNFILRDLVVVRARKAPGLMFNHIEKFHYYFIMMQKTGGVIPKKMRGSVPALHKKGAYFIPSKQGGIDEPGNWGTGDSDGTTGTVPEDEPVNSIPDVIDVDPLDPDQHRLFPISKPPKKNR